MARPRSKPTMSGDQLTSMMERRNLEKQDLAEILNNALGRNYNVESIRRWQTGARAIPRNVEAFLEELALDGGFRPDTPPAPAGGPQEPTDEPSWAADTEPGPGPSAAPQAPLGDGGAYQRACEDLWEMIATGIGMIGAATGSDALMYDGQVILQDKQALGAAWGRLAASNDTFRRMLIGMTEGGAWLQVSLVTGTTLSRCWQGHAQLAAQKRQASMMTGPEPEPVAAGAGANGYGFDGHGHEFGTPGLG